MIRRQPSLISIADEKTIDFLTVSANGGHHLLASLPLADLLEGKDREAGLPKSVMLSVNQLLVVPDYWVGNRFDAFQARKHALIAGFIERKLKLEQPTLSDAGEFYTTTIVQTPGQPQQLYSCYLQETIAYQLYRRLEALGLPPHRITTPAFVWQAKLTGQVDGFAHQGCGLIHLGESDCHLYFFFLGQFLFSRHILFPVDDGDRSQIYNLLNYEINQSFHLYSQKAKRSVESLYLLSADSAAEGHLAGLLGRQIRKLPDSPPDALMADRGRDMTACRNFSPSDLRHRSVPALSHRPLQRALAWRPVQWAGLAVGLVLAVLLALQSGYLYHRSGLVGQQMRQLKAAAAEQPEEVFTSLSQALDEIAGHLARPLGSGTVMRALPAMPQGMTLTRISLQATPIPQLKIDATVDVDHPERFKALLRLFLDQLNQRFDVKGQPVSEKDVDIYLERSYGDEKKPLYRISLGFEVS